MVADLQHTSQALSDSEQKHEAILAEKLTIQREASQLNAEVTRVWDFCVVVDDT